LAPETGTDAPSRALIRRLRADPDHAPETFVLFALDHLGEGAREYAERARREDPPRDPAELSVEVHQRAVQVARIDGAISGCPFFIALVPAYVAMLWEQARMALRIAALYGNEPGGTELAAELLWLRGVQPSLEAARNAVDAAGRRRTKRERRGLRAWIELGQRFLVMAGFLSPPDPGAAKSPLWRRGARLALAGVVWVGTWVFPATFMLVMAFGCVNSTNALGTRARAYYGGDGALEAPAVSSARPPLLTRAIRAAALALSIGIPLAALAISAHSRPAGIHWYYVLAALLGVSLVLGLSARTARR
jgi:hypothetical protein